MVGPSTYCKERGSSIMEVSCSQDWLEALHKRKTPMSLGKKYLTSPLDSLMAGVMVIVVLS